MLDNNDELKFSTEELYLTGKEIRSSAEIIAYELETIRAKFESMSLYWSGKAADVLQINSADCLTEAEELIRSLRQYDKFLQTIAANYGAAETSSIEEAQILPDIILE